MEEKKGLFSIFRNFRRKKAERRRPEMTELENRARQHTPKTKNSVASWPESMNPDHGETHEGDEIQEEVRKHRHGG